jgi:phage portal protein BeeE
VPAFKIGVGTQPTYSNGEILDNRYYSDCLQSHIEHMELALDEGLGIGVDETIGGKVLGVEMDLDGLLRMDTATQVTTLAAAVGGTIMSPNEARAKMDLPPVDGGDAVLSQQQNFSLEALAERDADKPFAKPEPGPGALTPGQTPPLQLPPGQTPEKQFEVVAVFRKELRAA